MLKRANMAVFLIVAVISAGCGDNGGDGAGTPDEIAGIILEIDSEGLGEVNSFRVKDGDDTYTVRIDPEREYRFNLGHLHEHLQNAEPVKVELESRGDSLFAVTIEDA